MNSTTRTSWPSQRAGDAERTRAPTLRASRPSQQADDACDRKQNEEHARRNVDRLLAHMLRRHGAAEHGDAGCECVARNRTGCDADRVLCRAERDCGEHRAVSPLSKEDERRDLWAMGAESGRGGKGTSQSRPGGSHTRPSTIRDGEDRHRRSPGADHARPFNRGIAGGSWWGPTATKPDPGLSRREKQVAGAPKGSYAKPEPQGSKLSLPLPLCLASPPYLFLALDHCDHNNDHCDHSDHSD
eukprot:365483-Chlamydomonas_euryale.AAC.4